MNPAILALLGFLALLVWQATRWLDRNEETGGNPVLVTAAQLALTAVFLGALVLIWMATT